MPWVHHVWAVEDCVIVRLGGSATTTGGRRYGNTFVWIFRMQEGRVGDAEAFLDLCA